MKFERAQQIWEEELTDAEAKEFFLNWIGEGGMADEMRDILKSADKELEEMFASEIEKLFKKRHCSSCGETKGKFFTMLPNETMLCKKCTNGLVGNAKEWLKR